MQLILGKTSKRLKTKNPLTSSLGVRLSRIIYLPAFLFLTFLLACGGPAEKQTLPDPLEAGWKGNSVCSVLSENEHARVLKCVFPPGVGHEKHYHDPHMGYTIAGGRFKITDEKGTREVEVKTGSTFEKEEITSHEVLNVGTTTGEFLIIEFK